MSVIGKWGSSGGGAGSAEKLKKPFVMLTQASGTTAQSGFNTFTSTKPFYLAAIEVIPLNTNGQAADDFTINTNVDGLTIDGAEMWFKSRTTNGGRLHSMTAFFGAPVYVTSKVYLNYSRLDGLGQGVRCLLRGYTLE